MINKTIFLVFYSLLLAPLTQQRRHYLNRKIKRLTVKISALISLRALMKLAVAVVLLSRCRAILVTI